jgi:hypothetical protein
VPRGAAPQETTLLFLEQEVMKVLLRFTASVCVAVFSVAFPVQAQNTQIASFAKAKKLFPWVHAGHRQTFYCGCSYIGTEVAFMRCGYL